MSNNGSPSHSGSRWEPAAGSLPDDASTVQPLTADSTDPSASSAPEQRRRRGPLLVVLAALVALGAASAGIAYVQAAPGASATDPATPERHSAPADGVPGGGPPSNQRADGGRHVGGDRDSDRSRRGPQQDDDQPGDAGDDGEGRSS